MFRFLIFVFGLIIGITVLRSIVGILMKAVASALQPDIPGSNHSRQAVPLSGELKRDPVCGTFVSTDSSIRQSVQGHEVYFCSEACRDKYRPA